MQDDNILYFLQGEPTLSQAGSPNGLRKTGIKSVLNAESNNYISEEELEPLNNPEKVVNTVLGDLKSNDWER